MATPSKHVFSRRAALASVGTLGTAVFALGSGAVPAPEPDVRKALHDAVFSTPLIDTHEHLVEESERLKGATHSQLPCNDWALLFSHYLNSDLWVAGMPQADLDAFLSPKVDPARKWELLAPYWPAVKNTGYAQAVRLAMRELYGVEELSAAAIPKLQAAYESTRRPGFYRRILRDLAKIESCQVNSLGNSPFRKAEMPDLLMQDISLLGFFSGPNIEALAKPAAIEVRDLSDWHGVIRWWFERHGREAVAVKSQNAYARDIDYARVPPEQAAPVFKKVLAKEPVSGPERKLLEDHLFWQAVDEATARGLPVKIHTGYYAGHQGMPLGRVRLNAGSASDLCRLSPNTRFVFMHLCYPYYEEMLALAKHYANAYIDMCWAWIINPLAAKDYFKKHLVTAPANKLLPFGGDYLPVEPVLGHAIIARRGMAQALSELVEERWVSLSDALALVEPILRGNAHRLFRLDHRG